MEPTGHPVRNEDKLRIANLDLPELYRCVHCGLCLNQCPTYRATGLETESPRGRIHLVKAAADGRIELNARFQEHIYLCLLCRACESACPSGVQYSRIAERARAQIGPPGSAAAQAIMHFVFTQMLPFPNRLKFTFAGLRLYQRSGLRRLLEPWLPRKLRDMDAMLPAMERQFFAPEANRLPAVGPYRATVAMFNGCIMPFMFGDVNAATVRVLRLNGCDVVSPMGQICCGALNTHNGESVAARQMARQNIDAFLDAGVDTIVVNAAGCGAALKEYDYLLRDDAEYGEKAKRFSARVKDAGEFLANLGLVGTMEPLNLTVTYQDPCHLAHGQQIRNQPRQLLNSIPGLRVVEMADSERCCGSAGIYNLTHSAMSRHLLEEKMQSVGETQAQAIVAPNPGCMLQLRYGAKNYGPEIAVYHLMDLLDRAYRKAQDLPKK